MRLGYLSPARTILVIAILVVGYLLTGCTSTDTPAAPAKAEPTPTATNKPAVNTDADTETEGTAAGTNNGKIVPGSPADTLLPEAKALIISAMQDQGVLTGTRNPEDLRPWLAIKPESEAARKFTENPLTLGADTFKGNGAVPAAPFGAVVSATPTPMETKANGDEVVNVDGTFDYFVDDNGTYAKWTVTRRWTLTLTPSGEDSRNWWVTDYASEVLNMTGPTPVKD